MSNRFPGSRNTQESARYVTVASYRFVTIVKSSIPAESTEFPNRIALISQLFHASHPFAGNPSPEITFHQVSQVTRVIYQRPDDMLETARSCVSRVRFER